MTTAAPSLAFRRTSLLRPILVGGSIAGALDLTSAFITNGVSVPAVLRRD